MKFNIFGKKNENKLDAKYNRNIVRIFRDYSYDFSFETRWREELNPIVTKLEYEAYINDINNEFEKLYNRSIDEQNIFLYLYPYCMAPNSHNRANKYMNSLINDMNIKYQALGLLLLPINKKCKYLTIEFSNNADGDNY
ncbi:unnamed protein product [Gordionus sp. m RMFG-2023]